jgi:hypothetical protein
MNLRTFIFLALLILVSTSCKKDNNSANDYASKVTGTYSGAVPPGIMGGEMVLSRHSNTTVNIDRPGSNGNLKHYGTATVSDGGDGKFNISLTTSSDTIIGFVKDSLFDCYVHGIYRFYGIKQ